MALDEVFASVSSMKPEEAADLLRLSREYKVPVQDVAARPDYFKNGVVDPGDWQDLVARAPKTSSFLENPLQMAINQNPNRVRHLSELETYLNPLPSMQEGVKDLAVNSVMSAIGIIEAGRYGALGQIENPKPEVSNLEFATNPVVWDGNYYALFDPSNGVKAKDLRQILKKEWLQPTEIKPADVPGGEWVQQLFRTAPQIAAQYALSMATAGLGTAGSLAAGTAFMGSQIAGGQYKELTEAGIDPERAWKAATTNAALQAPLEAITIEGIAKGHLKNWIKTKFPAQAGKALTIETAAIAGLSEFITETVQKYPEAAAEIWAKHENATPREQFALFMDDFWKITKEGMYEGSLAAPFGVFGGAVNAHYSRKAAEKNIQLYVDRLGAIATEIQRRDLLSHSPESVRDFVDHVTGGEVVYVEPAALNQLYQSDSIMSQEEINNLLGITPEQVQTATETGEMVAVPVASYVTAVAEKPEIHAALKEHLAAEVDEGITLARVNKRNEEDVAKAQASVKQYNEELKAELEKTKTNLAAAATGLKGVPKDSINRIVDLLEKRAWAAYDNGQVASPAEWVKANQLQFNRAFGNAEEARAWVPAGLVEGVDYAVMNQNGRAVVSFLSGKGIAEASQKGPLNTGPDTPSVPPVGGSTPVSLTELEQAFADRAVSAVMQAERMMPSNDVDVILGENPELYSIHNIQKWKVDVAKWMKKNGKSKQEIADHLNAVDKQLAIFSALGKFEVEVFPHTVDQKNNNPIRSNSDPIYKLSFDLSAMCVKRLSAQATRVYIEEQLGRPMSAPELTAMVAMFKIAGKPAPCLYCYVEAPRAKANEFLQTAYDLAFNTEDPPSGWGKESLEMLAAARTEVKEKGLTEAEFRIINDPAYGVTEAAAEERASKPALYAFLAKQYNNAKSNLPKLYAEYAGQILGVGQEVLDEIQNYAGFRYFSSSDFQYEHVVDLMQSFLDMQLRGMKSHSYTKVWEYAKIFGKTGQKIQLSVFAKKDAQGNIVQDTWQGMDWEKARELRAASKDTGTILVATSDEIILWGLQQPWIDYIIPFHLSGIPKEYAEDMQGVNYTGTQAETSLDPDTKAAKIRMHEMGTEKGISDEKGTKAYLELALKRRLMPVFPQFLFKDYDPNKVIMNKRGTEALAHQDEARLDAAKNRWREMVEKGKIDWDQINPTYFKLKKDYARTDTPFQPVQAKFDMPTVKQVLAKLLADDGVPKAVVETEIADKLIPLIDEYQKSGGDIGLDKLREARMLDDAAGVAVQLKENHAVYNTDEEALRYATEALAQTVRVEESAGVQSQQGTLDGGQQQGDSRDQKREVSTGRGIANTVGYGITPELISKGAVSLLGKTVRSSRELAVKAQALRHPGYETLHIIYTRQGQVVHHEALSCRLPGMVKFDYNDGQHPVLHIDETLTTFGADGWYFLHNHPSGRPNPSPEDVRLTTFYGDIKTSTGSTNNPVNRGFKGHVVINSTQFAVIDRAGRVTMEDLPTKILAKPDYFTPSKPHPALKTKITDLGDIAGMAKALQLDPDVSVVFVTDTQLVTRAVVEVQNSLFDKDSKTVERYLRMLTRAHNGTNLFLSTTNRGLYDNLARYVERGFFVDVVHTDSESGLRASGVQPGAYANENWMGLPTGQKAPVARVLEKNMAGLYQTQQSSVTIPDLDAVTTAQYQQISNKMRQKGYDWRGAADAKELIAETLRREGGSLSDDLADVVRDVLSGAPKPKAVAPVVTTEAKRAKKEFGLTSNFKEAGYLLPDGSLLDFSEKRDGGTPGVRSLDHRNISRIDITMLEFMAQGNIRIMAESPGFDLMTKPTAKQKTALRRYISENIYRDDFYIDLGIPGVHSTEHLDYPKGTYVERILNDIDHYYETGEVRKTLHSRDMYQSSLGFYSATKRSIEAMDFKVMPAADLLNRITKTPGIKQEELDDLGLVDWLKGQPGKVTKEQVLAFVEQGGPKLEEVTKGAGEEGRLAYDQDPEDGSWRVFTVDNDEIIEAFENQAEAREFTNRENSKRGNTKFGQYQLPGGENYREVLLTLPDALTDEQNKFAIEAFGKPYTELSPSQQSAVRTQKSVSQFKSSHWSEPNVLAHFRLNDRTVDGKKVLFIEEIQSDWHQELRKTGRVPDAPFKSTPAWSMLAFKRILRMAVEQGYDSVAWTPGEVQAERYDLSKQVGEVFFNKNGLEKQGNQIWVTATRYGTNDFLLRKYMEPKEIEDTFGKEIAGKIVDNEKGEGTLSGLDLRVGGEGMKGFYDRILPAEVGKYIKKLDKDAKVGTTTVALETVTDEESGEDFPSNKRQEVWSIPITDKIRNSVMQGQPLYQFAGQNAATANLKHLAIAKEMVASGENPEEVRKITGWFQGADRLWRFEINDSKAEILKAKDFSDKMVLGDLLAHPDLYAAYPDLKNLRVIVEDKAYGDNGSFSPARNEITLSRALFTASQNPKMIQQLLDNLVKWFAENPRGNKYNTPEYTVQHIQYYKDLLEELKTKGRWQAAALKVVLHEVQHYVQEKENFARGGSPEDVSTLIQSEIAKYRTLWDKLNAEWQDIGVRAMKAKGKKKQELKTLEQQKLDEMFAATPPLALEAAHRELKAKLGESPDPQKAFEAYRRLAGEAEARDVSDRMDMTEQDRIDTPPNIQADALVVWGDSTTILRSLDQDVRGAFAYQDGKAVITLFESSDVSTLLHEMVGHFFIHNLLRDTSAATAQDRKTLLDFIGMTPEEWAAENAAYESGQISDRYRAGMEKLASAVESYFYEGNAPSLATRGLFAKFKEWLAKTYKDISDIGVRISPEVRDVFDRLLAGQSEIAEMQRIEAYHAKLPTEVLETLSPDDQDRYDRLVRGAREEAESILQARLLDHLTTNAKLARAEAKLQAEKNAAAEVDADPFYALLAEIEKDYKNNPRTVAKRYQDTALPMDQEYDWDVRAQDAGYSSGAHMAATILEAPTRDQAIKAKVEAAMKEWADLYLDKGKLREAAREAMYSDGGRELLAVEQQILQEKLGKVLKDSQVRYEAKLAAEKAVTDAKEILAARPLRDALRVQTYVASERKAAENSARALAKGDVAEAYVWKQKQLLGHALVQESLNLRRETEKLEKYLKRQKGSKQEGWKSDDTDEDDLRSVTMRHFHAAAEILLRFGYKRSDYNPAMREENLAAYVARMTEENPDMVDIPEWIHGSDRVATPRELTIEELRDVAAAIKNIKLMARAGRNADGFVAIHGEDFSGLGEAVALAVAEAEANAKDVQQDAMGEIKKPGALSKYFAGLKKPSQHLLHLDGYKDFGVWDRLLYHFVQSAQNLKSSLVAQVVDAIDAAYNSQGISKEQRQIDAHVKIAIPEWNTSVTKNTLRAIALNMGSKSNMERLLSSPPVGLPAGIVWDEASVRKVLGKYLTESDLRLTQKLWDAINLLFAPYNAMVKRMTGRDLTKVEAQPVVFEMENGTQVQLRGGYYPLAQDPRESKIAEMRAEQKASEGFVGVMPYPNSGASKARVKKAAYAVDLRLDNMIGHLTDVAQDIAFRPVMHDVNKIMRQDAIKEIMRRKLGDAAYAQLGQWQKVIAKGRDAVAESSSPFDGLSNAIRQRTTIANLLLRPATVLQNAANPTLYGKAVQEFGEKDAFAAYLTYGWMGTADTPAYIPHALRGSQAAEDLRQLVYALSPMMRDKMENPDYSLREMHGLIKYENSLMNFEATQKVGIKLALSHEKVVDFGSRVLAFADQLTDIPMWLGAFEKGRRLGMDDAAAARLADTVIERSTGSGRTIDTSGMQRGSAAERLFSMFMTFMNTQYNRWAMEYNIALKEKDAMRLMSFVATKYLLFGFVSALASFKWPEEDDDPWKWFAKEVLAWPVGMFPVMGSAFKGVIDKALGYKTFGYSISPAERGITDILRLIQNAQSENKTLRENTELGMQVAAFLFRYPDQINDWLNNTYDIMTGEMEFQGTDIVRRRPKKER